VQEDNDVSSIADSEASGLFARSEVTDAVSQSEVASSETSGVDSDGDAASAGAWETNLTEDDVRLTL
jgi:hypothetical protein